MADTDKKTRKVKRDTDTVKGLDLSTAIKWAKSSPWVLAMLAGGGGFGGQEIANVLGGQVVWWQIALGVAGIALFDLGSRGLRRLERAEESLDRIEQRLAEGTSVMRGLRTDVDDLRAWRQEREQDSAGRNGKP